jgi:hypothetical protein
MEVEVHLITGIRFAEFGVTIPHGQYVMKMICDCSFIKLTQWEMYGIAQINLADH